MSLSVLRIYLDHNGHPRNQFLRIPHQEYLVIEFILDYAWTYSNKIITTTTLTKKMNDHLFNKPSISITSDQFATKVKLDQEDLCTGDLLGRLRLESPLIGPVKYRLGTSHEQHQHHHHSGFLLMEPKLAAATFNICSISQVSLLTLVSKWMPRNDPSIRQIMRNASEAGYNMIHWTPLQARGSSDSPYSIADHLGFNQDLFTTDSNSEGKQINSLLQWMRGELGLLSMADIVWNHASCDAPWLEEHPDTTYTPYNTPHLRPAYELDELLMEFSRQKLGLSISSEEEAKQLVEEFKHQMLPRLRLWEYWVIDKNRAVNEFISEMDQLGHVFKTSEEPCSPLSRDHRLLEMVKGHLANDGKWTRQSVYIKGISDLVTKLLKQIPCSAVASLLVEFFAEVVDVLNLPLYQAYDKRIDTICKNLFNRLRYERVDPQGPCLGPITERHPINPTYFTRKLLPRITKQTRLGHVFYKSKDGDAIIPMANNGWIFGCTEPLRNFAKDPASEAYLLRKLIVWGDCVKLRYGEEHDKASSDDTNWLWQYMTKYTEQAALMFDAFRLDNCHSTPHWVARELLKRARAINPNLWICAELFTSDAQAELYMVKSLGLHSVIRETMAAHDESHLIHCLDNNQGIASIHALFADCTHDNPTPSERRTLRDALPSTALVSFTPGCAIASVKGYDDLIPSHLNIVLEKRTYPVTQDLLAPIRRLLNDLHVQFEADTRHQARIEQVDDVTHIERQVGNLIYHLVCRHAFKRPVYSHRNVIEFDLGIKGQREGEKEGELILSALIVQQDKNHLTNESEEEQENMVIKGVPSRIDQVPSNSWSIEDRKICIQRHLFPPGSVLILKEHSSNKRQ